MTDLKMREEFEVWAVSQCSSIKRSVAMPERYATDFTQGAWLGWQASRAAVVIELPPPYPMPSEPEFADDDSHMDAYHAANGMRHVISKSIEAAGVKVKA